VSGGDGAGAVLAAEIAVDASFRLEEGLVDIEVEAIDALELQSDVLDEDSGDAGC
jgi:hypothetical protein